MEFVKEHSTRVQSEGPLERVAALKQLWPHPKTLLEEV